MGLCLVKLELHHIQAGIHTATDTPTANDAGALRVHVRVDKSRRHHCAWFLAMRSHRGSLHMHLEQVIGRPVCRAKPFVEDSKGAEEDGSRADGAVIIQSVIFDVNITNHSTAYSKMREPGDFPGVVAYAPISRVKGLSIFATCTITVATACSADRRICAGEHCLYWCPSGMRSISRWSGFCSRTCSRAPRLGPGLSFGRGRAGAGLFASVVDFDARRVFFDWTGDQSPLATLAQVDGAAALRGVLAGTLAGVWLCGPAAWDGAIACLDSANPAGVPAFAFSGVALFFVAT